MEIFKVSKFESNNVADSACKELFSKTPQSHKSKNKTKTGKVTKRAKKNKNLSKSDELKNGIKAILQNNPRLTQGAGIKIKNPKTKQISNKKGRGLPVGKEKPQHTRNETKPYKVKDKQKSPIGREKKKKRKTSNFNVTLPAKDKPGNSNDLENPKKVPDKLEYKQKKREKLKEKLQQILHIPSLKKQKFQLPSLRERMMEKLQAARFRYINEQMYSSNSKEAQKIFNEDPDTFQAYHEGYRRQVNKWPLNPLDVIIKSVQKMPQTHIIADFGCGDAKLAKSVEQKVHSFDLVAVDDFVTPCDMAHVPLANSSVDVVVFCLSLMGTNLHDYLLEANRVLKLGGILKVAEVESRFEDVNQFVEGLRRFNFKNTWKDLSHNLFYFLDFKKESNIKNKKKLPTITLHPCLYKKR